MMLFRVAISQEKAVETVGPKLTKQNIVSLIFLLLDDPAQALDYCLRVEQGRFVILCSVFDSIRR